MSLLVKALVSELLAAVTVIAEETVKNTAGKR
jgi:hypothetical protein